MDEGQERRLVIVQEAIAAKVPIRFAGLHDRIVWAEAEADLAASTMPPGKNQRRMAVLARLLHCTIDVLRLMESDPD